MNHTIFTYTLIIKESHLDTFGHVNNAIYLEILEESRWELITHNGYGLNKIKETQIGPVVLAINIKFLKELHLREKITIYTVLSKYEGKIAIINQRIFRQDELCCEADLTVGLFDLTLRKLIPPTTDWLKAIGYQNDDEIKQN